MPTQRERRRTVRDVELDVRAQVLDRDGCCVLCGGRERLTLQHILPRSAGGSSVPIDARLGLTACGSGVSGCHGAIERAGRQDQWAYDLGYLLRHGATAETLRADPDVPWLVWGHADRVWWELHSSGTRIPVPQAVPPGRDVLALVDAAISRKGRR